MGIRILILDVDGTLTDSTIFYGDNDIELKAFSTKDGAILKPLGYLGIDVVFLTGRESQAVKHRAADLGATAIQGIANKLEALQTLLYEYDIGAEQCAYVGDDLNDYAALKLCGFRACPADAVGEIREICDYTSPYNGGHGAVRDICENMLRKEGKYNQFLDFYGVGDVCFKPK